jgi:hypothetical protein
MASCRSFRHEVPALSDADLADAVDKAFEED